MTLLKEEKNIKIFYNMMEEGGKEGFRVCFVPLLRREERGPKAQPYAGEKKERKRKANTTSIRPARKKKKDMGYVRAKDQKEKGGRRLNHHRITKIIPPADIGGEERGPVLKDKREEKENGLCLEAQGKNPQKGQKWA